MSSSAIAVMVVGAIAGRLSLASPRDIVLQGIARGLRDRRGWPALLRGGRGLLECDACTFYVRNAD